MAFTQADETNIQEIYAFLSQPSVALPNPDKSDGAGEKFDSSSFLGLISRWSEAQRFPREYLLQPVPSSVD